MGYAPPGTNPLELVAMAQEAERLGFDSAWAAEAWGTDAVTVRAALRRDTVEHHGEHYRIPYDGPGATGLGKPLKIMARPLRPDIPIWLAAIGPKNVELAAEIADGWMPIFFDPERFDEVFKP